MKRMTHGLSNFIMTVMITALLLTGAVPSFEWDMTAAGPEPASSVSEVYAAEESDEASGASNDTDSAGASDRTVLPAITIDKNNAPKVNGKAAITMDMTTGTVVYEKNADEIREPASTTKILNALVVLETLDLDEVVTIPDDIETSGSVIFLEPGEKITVEELLYGMMLPSGNDAAEALAIAAGGSVEKFSEMMNARAKACGAVHTDFRSPNGLNENPDQLNYTTARDMALITREAMKNPEFRKIVKTKKHIIPATNKSEPRKLVNSNVCLWRKVKLEVNGKKVTYKYPGCNGVKTGFTSDAGYCLVGSAKRDGTGFIAITLGADGYRNRCRDVIKMWDYGFGSYETYKALTAGSAAGVQRVWGGKKREVEVGTARDLGVTINKGTAEEQGFTTEFRLDNDKAEAPVNKGQKMGTALVFNNKGRLVGAEDLYALASVAEGGPLSKIGIADEDLPMVGGIAGAVILLILILIIVHRSRKRRNRRRKKETIRGELKSMRTSGTGMTARELTDLTGVEEFVPIPKGPSRISSEELNAWTSTSHRPQSGSQVQPQQRPPAGRFSAPDMPRMKITPRTSFTTGETDPRTDQPLQGSMTDEELFAALESTEVYDINQPRRHGKLTDTERREVMSRTRRGYKSDKPQK